MRTMGFYVSFFFFFAISATLARVAPLDNNFSDDYTIGRQNSKFNRIRNRVGALKIRSHETGLNAPSTKSIDEDAIKLNLLNLYNIKKNDVLNTGPVTFDDNSVQDNAQTWKAAVQKVRQYDATTTAPIIVYNEIPTIQTLETSQNHADLFYNDHQSANYAFDYSVNDPTTGDVKDQQEEKRGDDIRGRYTVVQPDGLRRTVQYTGGNEGFNAVVRYTLA